MICPNCSGNFEQVFFTDISRDRMGIEKCEHCGGFWLNESDLGKIPKNGEETLDFQADESYNPASLNLDCPKCHIPMDRRHNEHFGSRDYWKCSECRGTWLFNGQLFNFLHYNTPQEQHQTDVTGTFTKRDRVLTGFMSVILVTMFGTFMTAIKTGYFLRASEAMKQPYDRFPWLWFLALIVSILIFSFGLSALLFKKAKILKILGSLTAVLSIVLLVYLMKV